MTDWYPGGSQGIAASPTYTTIRVYDAVFPELTRKYQLDLWPKMRDLALAEWEQAGLRFSVEPRTFRWPDNSTEWNDIAFLESIDHECIILRPMVGMTESPGGHPASASYTDTYGSGTQHYGVGLALFDETMLGRRTLELNRTYVRAVIGHEVGHCLGFGHGGLGIMGWGYTGGAPHVSDEEIAVVQDWYGVGV